MKPKVLFILHLPPPVTGAGMVGKYIKENENLNLKYDADFINLTTAFSLNSIGKGSLKKYITIIIVFFRILKALLSKKYDLCYMTLTAKGAGFYKDVLIVTLLKIFRKKIVYHFHNKGVKTRAHKKVDNFLYKFTFKNTKSILLAKSLYQDIEDFVSKEDVLYCPNGIPDIDIPIITNNKKKIESDTCKLLFLSNMMEEKGVYILLEACKLLDQKNMTYECHFVGDWLDITLEKFDKKCLDLGLKSNIIAHGKKYGKEKIDAYLSSDFFILPTYNDCFSLVLLEAMQAKLPVISTYTGGIPDIIVNNETGFLIENKNAGILAKKIEELILAPEVRKKMAQLGRKRYEELFTLEAFNAKFLSTINKCIHTDY